MGYCKRVNAERSIERAVIGRVPKYVHRHRNRHWRRRQKYYRRPIVAAHKECQRIFQMVINGVLVKNGMKPDEVLVTIRP